MSIEATYISDISFYVTGNYTSVFHQGRRVKYLESDDTVIGYGTISGSNYTTVTTIILNPNSDPVTSAMAKVEYSIMSSINSSIPIHDHTVISDGGELDLSANTSITTISGNLQTQITANANNISSNDADITNLQTDLDSVSGTLQTQITSNDNDISINTFNVAQNIWDISVISGTVNSNYTTLDNKIDTASGTLQTQITAGAFDDPTINSINKIVKNSAFVDVFIYDTTKDTDGGAWRKKTTHTSWYNETLNTAYRGATREFPEKVLIVLEDEIATFYDLTDSTVPMWKVFNSSTTGGSAHNFWYPSIPATSVIMRDGLFVLGMGVANTNGGTREVSFIADTIIRRTFAGGIYNGYWDSGFAGTGGYGYFTPSADIEILGESTINDIAITVLPNAPIDPITELPTPTIAVATDGGTSVIMNDGNVYDSADANVHTKVAFDKDLRMWGLEYSNTVNDFGPVVNIAADAFSSTAYSAGSIPSFGGSVVGLTTHDIIAIGAQANRLSILSPDTTTQANGMVSYITTDYNTGWMPGDIKGCCLSDSTTETLTAGDVVTNGDFSTDTDWIDYLDGSVSGTVTISGGELVITQGSNSVWMGAYQALTTVVGKSYTFIGNRTSGNAFKVYIGSSATTGDIYNSGTQAGTGTFTFTFTAVGTTSYLTLLGGSGPYLTDKWDDVSVSVADHDRSVNGNGLIVYGSITKAAVATGAELVGYSGFTTSNYLEQPYNSDLDYGTGDFYYSFWLKEDANDSLEYVFTRGYYSAGYSGNGHIFGQIQVDGTYRFFISDDNVVSTDVIDSTYVVDDSLWHKIDCVRRGSNLELWIDGKSAATPTTITNATGSLNNTLGVLGIGIRMGISTPLTNGTLALFRTGAYALSQTQIEKMYNDEKFLFAENADCLLGGSSNAILNLSYDKDTNLLHTVTSQGRSSFNGLKRYDYEATSVGTPAAVSAVDGLISQAGSTAADIYVPEKNLREELSRVNFSEIDHGSLSGLLDNNHTQYVLRTDFTAYSGTLQEDIIFEDTGTTIQAKSPHLTKDLYHNGDITANTYYYDTISGTNFSVTASGSVSIGEEYTESYINSAGYSVLLTKREVINPTDKYALLRSVLFPKYSTTANSTNYGQQIHVCPVANTGVTNNSTCYAIQNYSLRNYAYSDSDDNGYLANIQAYRISYGHFNNNPDAYPTSSNCYGLHINPFLRSGSVNNLFDIYITPLNSTASGDLTGTHYSIYQPGTTTNYFKGYMGLNTTDPSTQLDVNGDITAISYYGDGTTLSGIATGAELSTTSGTLQTQITEGDFDNPTINTINKIVNTTTNITDVFIYDTTKDSDGGAWRKKCQNTSWYNETLSTSNRGITREFPEKALLMVKRSGLYIYDLTVSTVPMWMIFTANGNWGTEANNIIWNGSTTDDLKIVKAFNGCIWVPAGGNAGSYYGLHQIDFIKDKAWRHGTNSVYTGRYRGNLSERDDNKHYHENIDRYLIKDIRCSDVAITVLPDAPIDAATGLPTPTIAVATDAGTSVIQNNGNVYDSADTNIHLSVAFDRSNNLWATEYNNIIHNFGPVNNIYTDSFENQQYHGSTTPAFGGSVTVISAHKDIYAKTGSGIASKLSILSPNVNTQNKGMVSNITTGYNTGWMPGDIKRCWLSDSISGTLGVDEDTEYHDDGNAASDNYGNESNSITGWSQSGLDVGANVFATTTGTVSVGTYAFEADANDTPTTVARFYKYIGSDFGLVTGKTYKVSFDARHIGVGGQWAAYLSSDSGGAMTNLLAVVPVSMTTWTSFESVFRHEADTNYFHFRETNAANDGGVYFDNFSVIETSNLIENGVDFNVTCWGWTAFNSSIAAVSDTLVITNTVSGSKGTAYQSTVTEVGRRYQFSADFIKNDGDGSIHIGPSHGSDALYNGALLTTTQSGITGGFTASTTSSFITLITESTTSGTTSTWDNISVRLVVADRSINDEGITIKGLVTESPVATGAELMGYSGFTTLNYLEQPYSSDLDYDTGNFYFSTWIKEAPNSVLEAIFERGYYSGGYSGNGQIRGYIETDGTLRFIISDDDYATSDIATTTGIISIDNSVFHKVDFIRRDSLIEIWVDAILRDTTTITNAAGSLSNANGTLNIGRYLSGSAPLTNGTLALFRTGAYAPSQAQIEKMYNDEKVMFETNADCLLSTSITIQALDYDKVTDKLYIGTDDGTDVFQGLKRLDYIDNSGIPTSNDAQAVAISNDIYAIGTTAEAVINIPEYNLREEKEINEPTAEYSFSYTASTTDATPTDIGKIPVKEGEGASFLMMTTAVEDADTITQYGSWMSMVNAYRSVGGNVTVTVADAITPVESSGTMAVTAAADTTAQTVDINVTGVAGTVLKWKTQVIPNRISDYAYKVG